MSAFEWTITTAITVLAILLIPAIGLLIRLVVKWTRTEYRIEGLTEDVKQLLQQANEDRRATDKRLRWLEETVWKRRGGGGNAIHNQGGGR